MRTTQSAQELGQSLTCFNVWLQQPTDGHAESRWVYGSVQTAHPPRLSILVPWCHVAGINLVPTPSPSLLVISLRSFLSYVASTTLFTGNSLCSCVPSEMMRIQHPGFSARRRHCFSPTCWWMSRRDRALSFGTQGQSASSEIVEMKGWHDINPYNPHKHHSTTELTKDRVTTSSSLRMCSWRVALCRIITHALVLSLIHTENSTLHEVNLDEQNAKVNIRWMHG